MQKNIFSSVGFLLVGAAAVAMMIVVVVTNTASSSSSLYPDSVDLLEQGETDKAVDDVVGYLPHGHSLVGMPLKFETDDLEKMGASCRRACVNRLGCHAYTYSQNGGCYLKYRADTIQGQDCQKDCWYSGVVRHTSLATLSIQEAKKDFGLKVKDVVVGKGARLKTGDTATIGYVGKLDDGTVFDSGKYVFEFGKGQVILGDDISLQHMRVGGERHLIIPASLGYGSQGYPGSIPPGATLHFDVKLLSISHQQLSSGYKLE